MASSSSNAEGSYGLNKRSVIGQESKPPTEQLYSEVRLFIANLTSSVSEHDLLTAFRPYGTLKNLDLVFHKNGPQKGQPKGYAFVEYAEANQAAKAKASLDGKPLRGREMHIGFASINSSADHTRLYRGGMQKRSGGRHAEEPSKPTSLSLNKNLTRNDTTNSRIAAMEAKLQAMRDRQEEKKPSTPSSTLPARPRHLPPKPMDSSKR
ncbi:uncharacterized protein FA14DRAFT_160350 [Meira miltonrushii]|uniref:RRM domain-containing protein n=1 Tax=Meira miltonrushii TaxID=1280837 RepID=A0A316VCF2_9BASI|nr:uncharacterized protein FA14DRAFT_160350 [Meira miltonrushii]PWN34984.1 hypothetical protein FA14DRAFT_160350 [Meira miltonrushii]